MWHSCLWCRVHLKITVLMTAGESTVWKLVLSKEYYLFTTLLRNRLSVQTRPCLRLKTAAMSGGWRWCRRSGTAHREVREEAGQEEEPVIKINPQHPLTLCAKPSGLRLTKKSCSSRCNLWPLSQPLRLYKRSDLFIVKKRTLCASHTLSLVLKPQIRQKFPSILQQSGRSSGGMKLSAFDID